MATLVVQGRSALARGVRAVRNQGVLMRGVNAAADRLLTRPS
ncbi:hypothetical protein AB0H83_19000 [Dactylosporangium sp. NPDC050688]